MNETISCPKCGCKITLNWDLKNIQYEDEEKTDLDGETNQ